MANASVPKINRNRPKKDSHKEGSHGETTMNIVKGHKEAVPSKDTVADEHDDASTSIGNVTSPENAGSVRLDISRRALQVALVALTGMKVIFSRLLFILHTFLTVWRTADLLGPHYWLFLLGLVALIVEAVLKLAMKKGIESKWFCPSVFLYLCTVVPAIWLLELDRLSSRQTRETNGTSHVINQTSSGLSSIEGIEIPIALSRDMWVLAIEQTLLFLLIIGRWMLPKGNISRDQLSQLLFVYIGIASDISEIFVLFEEQFVIDRPALVYIILTAWSLSLLQYTLVLTATKSRKTRVAHAPTPEDPVDVEAGTSRRCSCCETETWAILTTVLLQDGPFLCIRLYVMIASMSLTYTILFYTFKNSLVLVLQIYRLVVINCDKKNEGEVDTEKPLEKPHEMFGKQNDILEDGKSGPGTPRERRKHKPTKSRTELE